MPSGKAVLSVPFGPITSTAPSVILMVTPLGSSIGFLPILDISIKSFRDCMARANSKTLPVIAALIHAAKNLAADLFAARLLVGPETLRGRKYIDAQSAEHFWNALAIDINAATRFRNALQFG